MKVSALNEFDLYLYHQGTNFYTYQMLGAHFVKESGVDGVRFAVWAPHARAISVVGDFNSYAAFVFFCHHFTSIPFTLNHSRSASSDSVGYS